MPLNPRSAAIWAHALEVDHAGQTKSALERRDGRRCCLGIACREAIRDGVRVDAVDDSGITMFDGNAGTLPHSVRNWLGAPEGDPMLDGEYATTRNDTRGETFVQIAAAIRRDIAADAVSRPL